MWLTLCFSPNVKGCRCGRSSYVPFGTIDSFRTIVASLLAIAGSQSYLMKHWKTFKKKWTTEILQEVRSWNKKKTEEQNAKTIQSSRYILEILSTVCPMTVQVILRKHKLWFLPEVMQVTCKNGYASGTDVQEVQLCCVGGFSWFPWFWILGELTSWEDELESILQIQQLLLFILPGVHGLFLIYVCVYIYTIV